MGSYCIALVTMALLVSLAPAAFGQAEPIPVPQAEAVPAPEKPSLPNASDEIAGGWWRWRHTLLFQGAFNYEDNSFGLTYRFTFNKPKQLAIFATISSRGSHKTQLIPLRPNVYVQVEEERDFAAMGIHKGFGLLGEVTSGAGKLRAFVDAGVGYTNAEYPGLDREPEEGFSPLLRTGVSLTRGWTRWIGRIEVGYRYADLRHVPESWFYVALGGVL